MIYDTAYDMALTCIYTIVSSTSEFMVSAAAFSFRDRGIEGPNIAQGSRDLI